MLKGFKEFISRGNVVDMAVGIIIGGAFTPIVTALTENVLMPIIAGLVGQPNFDQVLAFTIGDSIVQPGTIITALINFLLIAAALYFCIVLPMNKLRERQNAKKPVEVEAPPADIALLEEIRDLLAGKDHPYKN
ncbi:large conductance mechanosensitive channel protein MscL [Arcanobacterium haemolyticum]|nr:large conductance mechanosensitive channel protein MscL [Arcanobacterium haemolyticum]